MPEIDRRGAPGGLQLLAPARRSADPAGCRSPRCPPGSRRRVMPAATICASHRIGAPAWSAARAFLTTLGDQARSATRSVIPQAWIIRTATCATSAGSSPRRRRFRPDRRERPPVDLGAVPHVLASHPLPVHQIPIAYSNHIHELPGRLPAPPLTPRPVHPPSVPFASRVIRASIRPHIRQRLGTPRPPRTRCHTVPDRVRRCDQPNPLQLTADPAGTTTDRHGVSRIRPRRPASRRACGLRDRGSLFLREASERHGHHQCRSVPPGIDRRACSSAAPQSPPARAGRGSDPHRPRPRRSATRPRPAHQERLSHPNHQSSHLAPPHPDSTHAKTQQRLTVIDRPHGHIRPHPGQIPAAVVQCEQEAPRQLGQRRPRAQLPVDRSHHREYVVQAVLVQTGQWRREDVAHALMA